MSMINGLLILSVWIALLVLWVFVRYTEGSKREEILYGKGYKAGHQHCLDHGYEKSMSHYRANGGGRIEQYDPFLDGFVRGVLDCQNENAPSTPLIASRIDGAVL